MPERAPIRPGDERTTLTNAVRRELKRRREAGQPVWGRKLHGSQFQRDLPDWLFCVGGLFIVIETKHPDGRRGTTTGQDAVLRDIAAAGGRATVQTSIAGVREALDRALQAAAAEGNAAAVLALRPHADGCSPAGPGDTSNCIVGCPVWQADLLRKGRRTNPDDGRTGRYPRPRVPDLSPGPAVGDCRPGHPGPRGRERVVPVTCTDPFHYRQGGPGVPYCPACGQMWKADGGAGA